MLLKHKVWMVALLALFCFALGYADASSQNAAYEACVKAGKQSNETCWKYTR